MGESGLAIKKTYRVKRSKDFDQIFSAKHSFANKRFVVYKLKADQPHFRVGHAIADFSPYLADEDFVIIARRGVETLNFEEIKKNLKHVLKLSKIYVDGEND